MICRQFPHRHLAVLWSCCFAAVLMNKHSVSVSTSLCCLMAMRYYDHECLDSLTASTPCLSWKFPSNSKVLCMLHARITLAKCPSCCECGECKEDLRGLNIAKCARMICFGQKWWQKCFVFPWRLHQRKFCYMKACFQAPIRAIPIIKAIIPSWHDIANQVRFRIACVV